MKNRRILFTKNYSQECTPRSSYEFTLCTKDEDPILTASLIIDIPKDAINILNLALGISIAKSLCKLYDVDVGLRWPNRIQLGRYIIGVYNVNMGRESNNRVTVLIRLELRTNYEDKSIRNELGRTVSNEAIAKNLVSELNSVLQDIEGGIRWRYVYEYMNKMANLGEEVRVKLKSGEEMVGEVIGLRKDGALAIYSPTGLKYINTYEVKEIVTLWP